LKTKNFEGAKLKKLKKLGGKILIYFFGKILGLPPGPNACRSTPVNKN
jgi:hypothetical protein